MKAFKRHGLLLLLVVLPACGQQLVGFPQTDGASSDAGMAEVLIRDDSSSAAAIADVPTLDAPRADTTTTDAESPDGAASVPSVVNTTTSPAVGAATGTMAWAGTIRRVHPRGEQNSRGGQWVPALVAVSRSS